jgi:hypothetical protein
MDRNPGDENGLLCQSEKDEEFVDAMFDFNAPYICPICGEELDDDESLNLWHDDFCPPDNDSD